MYGCGRETKFNQNNPSKLKSRKAELLRRCDREEYAERERERDDSFKIIIK